MRISQLILRRSLPQLLAIVLVAALSLFYSISHLTAELDRKIVEHSRILVQKTLADVVKKAQLEVAGLLVAGRLSGPTLSLSSAGQEGSAAFCASLGCDGVYLIDDKGKSVDAFNPTHAAPVSLSESNNVGVMRLAALARNAAPLDPPIAGLIEVNDLPMAVAASKVRHESAAFLGNGAIGSVLMIVDELSPEELAQLGLAYGVVDLHPGNGNATATETSVDIERIDNSTARFIWTTPGFGEHSLEEFLPAGGLAALLIALFIGLILRDAFRAAKQFEAQHASLLASQVQLAGSETRFRDIAEAASDWLWETDAKMSLIYLSDRFEQVTFYSPEQWLGRSLGELLQAEDENVDQWLRSQSPRPLRCRYVDQNGSLRICRLASRPVIDGTSCTGFRGTTSDITEEVKARTEIEHLSLHDALTGLPNRTQLRSYLAQRLKSLHSLAVLSLDLDRFKPVNDTLGHAAGDRVLHDISLRLLECTRKDDLVARLGGDEFIMVLSGDPTQQTIEAICLRIIEQIRQPILYEGQDIYVGCSIGIALAPQDSSDEAELLRCADIALYQAKADGRATWRFFASEMNDRLVARRQLEVDLRQAITRGEMALYFQPRYRTGKLNVIGAETLVRWYHPSRGLLTPEHFIGLAEETGLIIPLGQWILTQACTIASSWPDNMVVSVNLSVVQFRQSNLVNDVRRALQTAQLPAARLELEVAESILLDDTAKAFTTLEALKSLGVRLTMDDFGTGYSSLNYLRNYPFDGLKIDRSFIVNMLASTDDQSIIKGIVGLAQALNINVAAEGVETKEQLDWLEQERCDEVQGFHMSPPQSEAQFSRLLGSLRVGDSDGHDR